MATPIASASLTTSASYTAFSASQGGTAVGSLTFDAERGLLLTNTNQFDFLSPTNYTQVTGDWCLTFELEHRAITVDQSSIVGTVMDSTNTLQTARASATPYLLQISNLGYDDAIRLRYAVGAITATYIDGRTFGNSVASTLKFCRLSDKQTSKRYVSDSTGVIYAKIAVSFDSVAREVTFWINGQMRMQMLPNVDYTTGSDLVRRIQFNDTANAIGDGVNNYWMRNLALYNQKYDPLTFEAPTNTGKRIKLAWGIDSFALGAMDVNAEFGAGQGIKAALESNYGVGCTLVYGLAENGQGYYTSGISNAEIDAVLVQSPTDVICAPSINDFGLVTATWSTGNTANWTAAVENFINRVGAGASVQRIWPLSIWNWLNVAPAAGFSGTDTGRAAAFFADPSLIYFVNEFFANLKSNTNITAGVRSKIQPMIDVSRTMGADDAGKGYPRTNTIGSHPSTTVFNDPHPTYGHQIRLGNIIANNIGQTVLGATTPSFSVRRLIARKL